MYYIAYGSNLNFKLMNSRCPRAKPVFYLNELRVNKLFGWRLSFNRYANIIKDKNSFVPIGLWKITKHCEKELDIYENFPMLYSKIYLKYKLVFCNFLLNNYLLVLIYCDFQTNLLIS